MNFALLTLTLSLHLACMNAASAGPLVCVWLDWRERRGDATAGQAGRSLALGALILFLAGMLLGVLAAWLAWTPEFWRDLLDRLPSRLFWGAWELAFSAALLAAYWGWWRQAAGGTGSRVIRSLMALASATNLLYHFPPLFALVAKLSSGERSGLDELSDESFRRLIWQGEAFALTVHFWLASLAVAGVLLALLAVRASKDAEAPGNALRLAVHGGRLAVAATLLQIPVGLWLMVELPTLRQNRLMGDDLLATSFLGGGVLGALWLLHHLAALAMGDTSRKTIWRSAALMLAVIVLMTAALRDSRTTAEAAQPRPLRLARLPALLAHPVSPWPR